MHRIFLVYNNQGINLNGSKQITDDQATITGSITHKCNVKIKQKLYEAIRIFPENSSTKRK